MTEEAETLQQFSEGVVDEVSKQKAPGWCEPKGRGNQLNRAEMELPQA